MSTTAYATPVRNAASEQNRTLVAGWLFAVCFMIWVMVGIGGFTRETGSGLSIMNWDPIVGAIPPISGAAWEKLFALYQTIPQAKILHPGITLDGFKALFWPEYVHRLWGRMIGIVFFVPLVAFIATRRIEARLIPWLVLLFALGGLQGAIGWFMVSSGFFAGSTAVEPWRLSLHFCAAMFLYAATLWTALTVLRPNATRVPKAAILRVTALAATGLLCVTLFAGTFVSGTHAKTIFNPATGAGMGAPPAGYALANAFTDKATVLFNHQAIATLAALALLAAAIQALRGAHPAPVRDAGIAIFALLILQFALGIAALVTQAMDLGVAHQLNAVLLLTACLVLLHNLRGAAR